MRRIAALTLALVAAACGGDPTPAVATDLPRLARLEVLDWETGRPAAALLLEGEELLRLAPADEPERWNATGGTATVDADGHLAVRAAPDQPVVALERRRLGLGAGAVDFLWISVQLPEAGSVRVATTVHGSERPQRRVHTLAVPVAGSHRVTVPIEDRGKLEVVRVELPDGASLRSVSARSRGIDLAPSPQVGPAGSLDIGLVQLERDSDDRMAMDAESRRTVPAVDGAVVIAPYEAGGAPRLYLAVALPDSARFFPGPVAFDVLARESIDAPPPEGAEVLESIELDPSTGADRWHPFWVDLPGADGESWEVVLRARGGRGPGTVNGYFTAPVLVRRAAPRPPDVVLVTTDTLRADHVGANRAALGLGPLVGLDTPFIDSLAARGTNYVDVLSTSNATSPSHATIHTGLFPRDHRVRDNERRLDDRATTLAELLRDDYFCVASVTTRHLNAALSGLGQGFDVVLETPRPVAERMTRVPHGVDDLPPVNLDNYWHRNAAFANPRLERFLADAGELPLFLWLHYFDPHTPYVVRDEIAEEFLAPETPGAPPVLEQLALRRSAQRGDGLDREIAITSFLVDVPHLAFLAPYRSIDRALSLYAAGVTQFDRDLAALFRTIDAREGEPYVLFTADHGEALGERDVWFDHAGAFDNTLRVPLILAGPGVPAGAVVDAPVSTVDVAPTLLGLLGVEPPEFLPGLDLLAVPPAADRRRWFQHSSDVAIGYRDGDRHVFYVTYDHEVGAFRHRFEKGQVTVEIGGAPHAPDADERARAEETVRAWMFAPVIDLDEQRADLSAAERAELRALGYAED